MQLLVSEEIRMLNTVGCGNNLQNSWDLIFSSSNGNTNTFVALTAMETIFGMHSEMFAKTFMLHFILKELC